MEYFY